MKAEGRRMLDRAAQHLKPGNPMPSSDQFEGALLRERALYLESLTRRRGK